MSIIRINPTWLFAGFLLASAASVCPAQPAGAAPYNEAADASKDVAAAQQRARANHKSVMVIFGANWCADCVVLHRSLDAPGTREYAQSHFEIVSVDVGKFDKNLSVVKSLGVDLNKGIPVAAFVASDGTPIGNTNKGELEASRNYQARQILQFLHEVVENHKIVPIK